VSMNYGKKGCKYGLTVNIQTESENLWTCTNCDWKSDRLLCDYEVRTYNKISFNIILSYARPGTFLAVFSERISSYKYDYFPDIG
jgi:hypothetical protein